MMNEEQAARTERMRDEQAARPGALGARVYGGGDDNVPGGRDTVGHSAVQGWSAGDIFPAVIAVVESYAYPVGCNDAAKDAGSGFAWRHRWTAFDLTLYGRTMRYATYDDAADVARAVLDGRIPRAVWTGKREG